MNHTQVSKHADFFVCPEPFPSFFTFIFLFSQQKIVHRTSSNRKFFLSLYPKGHALGTCDAHSSEASLETSALCRWENLSGGA